MSPVGIQFSWATHRNAACLAPCLCVVLCLCMALCLGQGTVAQEPQKLPFYIGTYTGGASRGIYRSELSLDTGALSKPQLVAEITNPSFLTIHPTLNVLYAVSEVSRGGDRDATQIMAYRILSDGQLQSLGGCPAGGDAPCYISTDQAGQFVFVANYGSGSITAIQLKADGSLGDVTSHIQHVGSSIDPRRQQAPHAHCILSDPSDQFVCAVDLGLDEVIVYRLDRNTGLLTATSQLKTDAGNGPRHLTFHPDGQHAFVIHELTSKLSSCSWDSKTGTLKQIETVSTLPADFTQSNATAEVLVHPSGKFVFGSNRGHNSIAVFRFEPQSGTLTSLGQTLTDGKAPRNFRIDPTGQFLLAENQGSDSIVVFRIDLQTGKLERVGQATSVGAPCCIKFLPQTQQ
jgi:6-phosphogluconolactonase